MMVRAENNKIKMREEKEQMKQKVPWMNKQDWQMVS